MEDFVKRLEILMEYYSLSASLFADRIGVQRSSISHLLSARNKPSLDFILKVSEEFPEISLYWLLNGKEAFLKERNTNPSPMHAHPDGDSAGAGPDSIEKKIVTTGDLADSTPGAKKEIYKIIIFYSDGTFKAFEQ